jgi:hypothetical protein
LRPTAHNDTYHNHGYIQAMVRNQIEPAWLSWGQAAEYSGLCVQTLRNAEKTGAFETRMVVIEGRSKGRRLINRESLDRWIWAQGEPQPKGLCDV